MLRATILSAVQTAKSALDDLVIVGKLVSRGAAVHVPGSPPTYPETLKDIRMVLVSYKSKDIDGDRIRANDVIGLVFPETANPVPNQNDVIRVLPADAGQFIAGDYRVIVNEKTFAGNALAVSICQLRLL